MSADCPNRPEWAMPGVAAIVGDGFCVHCSKVAGEWVACKATCACDAVVLDSGHCSECGAAVPDGTQP